jgi:hypothetical protein
VGPLAVDTLADRLRAARADASIVSISLKDRGAIFGGGRKPTAVLWYSPKEAAFVTSTAFAPELPAWSLPVARDPLALAPPVWQLADPEFVKTHAAAPDNEPSEGDYEGLGATFPHPIKGKKESGERFRATPFGDAAVLALAEAALDALPAGRPTLLALSLSSNDYVGHVFGPDSWEAWDELVRLDAALGKFFAALDRRFGDGGWSLLLAADHGGTPSPDVKGHPWCEKPGTDRWGRVCGGGRLVPTALDAEMRKVARSALGEGDFIAGVADPYVVFTPRTRALPPEGRAKLVSALTSALTAHPEVAQVFDVAALPRSCPPESDESIPALVCRGSSPSAGDLYVLTKPGSFFDAEYAVGHGTSHGTPYLFDRAVPLVVRAPGRIAAGKRVDAPQSFRLFAETAASLFSIGVPGSPR